MILERLDASVNNTAYFTSISAVCPYVHFIPVTGQESLGNAPVAADVTDVFWFPDVHHVHMILKITLG